MGERHALFFLLSSGNKIAVCFASAFWIVELANTTPYRTKKILIAFFSVTVLVKDVFIDAQIITGLQLTSAGTNNELVINVSLARQNTDISPARIGRRIEMTHAWIRVYLQSNHPGVTHHVHVVNFQCVVADDVAVLTGDGRDRT